MAHPFRADSGQFGLCRGAASVSSHCCCGRLWASVELGIQQLQYRRTPPGTQRDSIFS
jgi:hypothetical protein